MTGNWLLRPLIPAILFCLGLSPISASGFACRGQPATLVVNGNGKSVHGTNEHDVIVVLGYPIRVRARGGNDVICIRSEGARAIEVQGGRGSDTMVGSPGRQRLFGGPGHDLLIGGAGDDVLVGEQGQDRLYGGRGRDHLNGGNGDDFLNGQNGSDYLVGDGGNDDVCGGKDGRFGDIVSYSIRYNDREKTFESEVGPVEVDLTESLAKGAGTDRLCDIENVVGTNFDDVLVGNAKDNVIESAGGDDVVRGGAGSDCMSPGRGRDELHGGPGYDFITYAFSLCGPPSPVGGISPTSEGVTIDLTEGYGTYNIEPEEDDWSTLYSIEGAFGSENEDILIGDKGNNRLAGTGGPDHIDGRAGDDTLLGGEGEDVADGGEGVDLCKAEVVLFCEGSNLLDLRDTSLVKTGRARFGELTEDT